ncbi:DNA-directed RNA polymerases I and III subunit RPAC2 isoform X1 [Perca flavescens]|uniref:DNA-directed RNA polymerases I and III subunit RPAC2 isoform X1 n=1 Tax=Perca flavescens TaxID=8167 RepID=UPI00106E2A85|nr:DNA-directed RNA polymerases I and III subunit RPAC2-like isoform X1 [Perca flavescens]
MVVPRATTANRIAIATASVTALLHAGNTQRTVRRYSQSLRLGKEEIAKQRMILVQADGGDEGCVTFVLHDEDHTLGNSLRYMIMKTVDVDFCGYTITHPSESKINFRIQTRGGIPATEPLRRGLNDLTDVCQHVLNTFQARVNEFKERQEQPME